MPSGLIGQYRDNRQDQAEKPVSAFPPAHDPRFIERSFLTIGQCRFDCHTFYLFFPEESIVTSITAVGTDRFARRTSTSAKFKRSLEFAGHVGLLFDRDFRIQRK